MVLGFQSKIHCIVSLAIVSIHVEALQSNLHESGSRERKRAMGFTIPFKGTPKRPHLLKVHSAFQ
jgi:hypothetical protein